MDSESNLTSGGIKHEFQRSADEAYSHLPPFDPAEYQEYVEEFDLTDDQKNELLATLWHIMASFVDLGFGVSSLHHVLPALAQISSNCESHEIEENNTTENFKDAAGTMSLEGE